MIFALAGVSGSMKKQQRYIFQKFSGILIPFVNEYYFLRAI